MTESSSVDSIPPPPGTENNPPLPPDPPTNTNHSSEQSVVTPDWSQYYYNNFYTPQYAQFYQYYMMQGYNYAAYQAQFLGKNEENKIQPPLPPGPPLPNTPPHNPRPPLLNTPKQFGNIRFQLNGKRLPNNNAMMQLNNSPNSGAAKKKRKRNRNNQNNQFNQLHNFHAPPLPPPEINLPKPAPPPESMPPEPPLPPLPKTSNPIDTTTEAAKTLEQIQLGNPSDQWPESLKEYVHRCYDRYQNEIDRNRIEIILKGKITQAYQNGQVLQDWSKEPVPNLHGETPSGFTGKVKTVPGQLSKFQNIKKGISPGLGARLGSRASTLRGKSRSLSRSRSRSPSTKKSRSRSRSPKKHRASRYV